MRFAAYLLVCSLLASLNAFAQSDWNVVRTLPRDARLVVYPQSIAGKLQAATADDIAVRSNGRSLVILRQDVQRIERVRRRTAVKAKRGFFIGWAIGTLSWRQIGWAAPVLGLGAAGVGALVGAWDGALDYKYETIYELPHP